MARHTGERTFLRLEKEYLENVHVGEGVGMQMMISASDTTVRNHL